MSSESNVAVEQQSNVRRPQKLQETKVSNTSRRFEQKMTHYVKNSHITSRNNKMLMRRSPAYGKNSGTPTTGSKQLKTDLQSHPKPKTNRLTLNETPSTFEILLSKTADRLSQISVTWEAFFMIFAVSVSGSKQPSLTNKPQQSGFLCQRPAASTATHKG